MEILKTVTARFHINFSEEELMEALVAYLKEKDYSLTRIEELQIGMNIPGGGDWSNTFLSIHDADDGLSTSFTQRTEL